LPLLVAAALGPGSQKEASEPPADWVIDVFQRGRPLVLALPAFEARDRGVAEIAAELARVLRADLEFASLFRILEVHAAAGPYDYKAWVGADLVVTGSVAGDGDDLVSEVRLHAVAEARVVFGTVYRAPRDAARRLAHRIADELVAKLGAVGVAETEIAFASERDGKRSLFRMDYDGFGPRFLAEDFLTLAPRWSPDGRSLLYVSYPTRSSSPALAVLAAGSGRGVLVEAASMVFPGSWSPDGSKIAFSSTRDGNAEIYVMNRDGTGLKRLTDHPAIDVSPTWSPTGRELAFTSDRSGTKQIYTMDSEGLNLSRLSQVGSYNAEPAWSPSKDFSEIAYASRIEGGVFDVVVHDLLTGQVRELTSQRGMNESPSWAPNGRHLVFSSTRTGEPQLFTINRDGTNLRRITFEGKNKTPSWGPARREGA
jgi:TolB protein